MSENKMIINTVAQKKCGLTRWKEDVENLLFNWYLEGNFVQFCGVCCNGGMIDRLQSKVSWKKPKIKRSSRIFLFQLIEIHQVFPVIFGPLCGRNDSGIQIHLKRRKDAKVI